MKKIMFIILILSAINSFANPSFTIGSNYYLTIFAYPHDILKWPNSAVFIYYNPQTMPWQGDVTDIANRPSESYVNNYQEVEFAPPYGYQGNPADVYSWMRVAGYAYRNKAMIGGIYNTDFGKFYVELDKTSLDMELTSEGIGRAAEDVGGVTQYNLVPFQGETNAAKDNYSFKMIYANYLFDNPFGLKFRYIKKSSEVPTGYLEFTRDGQKYHLSHLTWGWATTGCNHIFGYSNINTDAFYQNSYSVFNGYQMDLQASYEYKENHKSGIRYRKIVEDGDNYRWEYNDGSAFNGRYIEDQLWKDRKATDLIRAYSKIGFWKFGQMDLGILFFLQYASYSKTEVNKITDSDPDSEESEQDFIIETNPFFNYKFKGGYVDFGILLELSYTAMENTRTRWNSVSRSDQKDVLWTTSPYSGWSPSWENFSKGSRWFFATGFEAYSSIGIYKRLSLLLRLTVLKKYSFIEKIYGESSIPDGSNSFKFQKTHTRDNYKDETWMTGSFGFAYGLGPIQTFITLQLPLAYLNQQETSLRDNTHQLFEHRKKNLWQVQEPITTRILFVYALSK